MRLIKFKKIISIVLLCTLVFNIKLINNNAAINIIFNITLVVILNLSLKL